MGFCDVCGVPTIENLSKRRFRWRYFDSQTPTGSKSSRYRWRQPSLFQTALTAVLDFKHERHNYWLNYIRVTSMLPKMSLA
jgi:hypothetical protein